MPNLTGSLVGYVFTFDEYGRLLNDHANVIVTTKGTNVIYSVATDEYGRFEFSALPTGTYDLEFKKDGFGTVKQFSIKHLGGTPTTLGYSYSGSINSMAFFLYQKSTLVITNLSVEKDSVFADLAVQTPESPSLVMLQLYFSTAADFTYSTSEFSSLAYLYRTNGRFGGKIFHSGYPFEIGTTYYVKARTNFQCQAIGGLYSEVIAGINSYYDFDLQQFIYPALGNESASYSFVAQ
jgi:hypothetical protein